MNTDEIIHIPIDRERFGHNFEIGHGFSLGLTSDGYGIKWKRGPNGLGQVRYWFTHDLENSAAKITFENKQYVFAMSNADDDAIESAEQVEFESETQVR